MQWSERIAEEQFVKRNLQIGKKASNSYQLCFPNKGKNKTFQTSPFVHFTKSLRD